MPFRRGSSNEEPMRHLLSKIKKNGVHDSYTTQLSDLPTNVFDQSKASKKPSDSLQLHSFYKVWRQYYPKLKQHTEGSGFCDTCHSLKSCLSTVEDSDRLDIENSLMQHSTEANNEFEFYRDTTNLCKNEPSNGVLRIVFNFAAKVILPSFRQPGSLHFITGVRFDLFGASCSNLKTQLCF